MSVFRRLVAGRCFGPALAFGEQLAAVHVPFDELTHQRAHEDRVRNVADGGGVVLVVGDSGAGKSSTVSASLSVHDGWLAVPIPISVPRPGGAPPSMIPGLVLEGFAATLETFDRTQAERAQLAATGERPRRRVSGELNIKGVRLTIGDLFRDLPRTTAAQRDAITQAAAACQANGLRVVLVLDDTDKWASDDDLLRVGRTFFDESLAALVDLGLSVVANAHTRYFVEREYPDRADAVVRVPRLGADGIVRILARRIDYTLDGQAVGVDAVFDDDAVTRITDTYTSNSTMSLRRVLQLTTAALLEAHEANLSRITVGAVQAAIDDLS